MTHALIIGKFYPPHVGHHAMVRFAATVADRVTVVVMSSAVESISLHDRVAWMTESHADDATVTITGIVCDAPIDHNSRAVWAAQVACMRAAVRPVTDVLVDAVVSSEPYGEELARWFDARHVPFDLQRSAFPVSGTRCRTDLAGSWDLIDAPARAGLTTRIVVLGAESTGTTTVSRALAEHFRTRWPRTEWVPEFGRQDTLDKAERTGSVDDIVWTGDDFARIAKTQTAMEDAAARRGSPVLICDTDAFATTVWERRYLGGESHCAVAEDQSAIYLVTDHEGVPFVQDGIRDGEHVRAEMTGWFIDALTRSGRSWVLLTGSHEERMNLAIRVAEQEVGRRMTFADPLTQITADPTAT
ncbi:transcriptional regulator NadR [Rhodococcoides trifolii]|uniref:Transcriptional regulator NadR n=1 Tax=Rhodococcoides trifolii TaxID=908250 RepID=A0A917CW60_9NOCA|nr:AAA family ATPase [Rhodococcus trifolii]GGF98827.1 transcriptional regulator NadR [Rhodococcus trifolii]